MIKFVKLGLVKFRIVALKLANDSVEFLDLSKNRLATEVFLNA
jgi:hypothetical protein